MINAEVHVGDRVAPRGKFQVALENAVNDAVVAKTKEFFGDLRDPETGREPKFTFSIEHEGISVHIEAAASVLQEMRKRLQLLG